MYTESKKKASDKYRSNPANKEKIKESQKRYQEKNKERLKQYRADNAERLLKNSREWKRKNRDRLIAKYAENRDKMLEYHREYRKKNREKIQDQRREVSRVYAKNRRKSDPLFRMRQNIGCRTYSAFKRIKVGKPVSTDKLLGASSDVVKKYIESQFKDGMSWENYGYRIWHIDHIIPLSSAKDLDELIALCHYSNLQPLWAEENIRKSNKLLMENT